MAKNYSKKLKNGQTETHISITPIQYNKSKMNPVPFIVKRVISNTAAGAGFNSQTSSCDVYGRDGKPCCADPRDAKQKNMPYCGSQKGSKK